MGLDITAYKNLTKVDAVYHEDGEPIDPQTRKPFDFDYCQPVPNEHYDRADGVTSGVYKYEDLMGFRAGSYGGYNQWRENLAKLSGWKEGTYNQFGKDWPSHAASAWEADSGPFWELINFSDCEGTIGPQTSAKLAKDFEEHQAKADAHESKCFRSLYADWRKAFEMASQNGIVSFH